MIYLVNKLSKSNERILHYGLFSLFVLKIIINLGNCAESSVQVGRLSVKCSFSVPNYLNKFQMVSEIWCNLCFVYTCLHIVYTRKLFTTFLRTYGINHCVLCTKSSAIHPDTACMGQNVEILVQVWKIAPPPKLTPFFRHFSTFFEKILHENLQATKKISWCVTW